MQLSATCDKRRDYVLKLKRACACVPSDCSMQLKRCVYKRQEEYREKGHPQFKRFTQQELNDEACPTYKNWLIGRSNRLPSRSLLMTDCRLSGMQPE